MNHIFPLQVLSENDPQAEPRHLRKLRIFSGLQLVYRNHWGLALPQRDRIEDTDRGRWVERKMYFEVQTHLGHRIWESGGWATLEDRLVRGLRSDPSGSSGTRRRAENKCWFMDLVTSSKWGG